jgi:hypothetical protein
VGAVYVRLDGRASGRRSNLQLGQSRVKGEQNVDEYGYVSVSVNGGKRRQRQEQRAGARREDSGYADGAGGARKYSWEADRSHGARAQVEETRTKEA